METTTEKNTATFAHLSALSKYFIPFGNYIFPVLIWTSKKDTSEFVNHHGKQVLNFQLSMLLYSLVLAFIAVPLFIVTVFKNIPFDAVINDHEFVANHFNFGAISGIVIVAIVAILVFICLKIMEFFLIIYASIKASNGEWYEYPLTINFLK